MRESTIHNQPPFNRLFLVGPFPLVWEFPICEKHNMFANSSQWDPFCPQGVHGSDMPKWRNYAESSGDDSACYFGFRY